MEEGAGGAAGWGDGPLGPPGGGGGPEEDIGAPLLLVFLLLVVPPLVIIVWALRWVGLEPIRIFIASLLLAAGGMGLVAAEPWLRPRGLGCGWGVLLPPLLLVAAAWLIFAMGR